MAPERANILVVDDTHANLTLLSSILGERGYRVRPVPSGKLALSAAMQEPPDLMLLDVSMPEMDGYEVCRRMKAHPILGNVPVLFISALSESLDKVRAFEAGGVDYVTKPFQVDELHARVETHLKVRRLQRDLEARVEQLQRLERLRDELTHMIVHDMRSVLSSLVASLQLVQREARSALSDENAEDIDAALSGGKRLSRMVNELLDISRLEAGQMPIALRAGDLRTTLEAARDALRGAAHTHEVRFTFQGDLSSVRCDHDLVGRVVVNLLHNALKFSPDGAPIEVVAEGGDADVVVRVRDRGPGVPERARGLIFEKFSQLEARRQGLPSTGLGLAFCKLAVAAHGGEIGVRDNPAGGSEFWFRIDRIEATAADDGPRL